MKIVLMKCIMETKDDIDVENFVIFGNTVSSVWEEGIGVCCTDPGSQTKKK